MRTYKNGLPDFTAAPRLDHRGFISFRMMSFCAASDGLVIYWDEIQEGLWFQGLHPILREAELAQMTGAAATVPALESVLRYDRPDIVLAYRGAPILVLERTVEVPSGHNVGQRFARLAAAAQARVPVVYFGPYAARKHGGKTEGPRYMNLRLFKALDEMARVESAAVTTINWRVDADYELVQTPEKDDRIREYLELFFRSFDPHNPENVNALIMASDFEREEEAARHRFISDQVRNPEQYDTPPNSVSIVRSTGDPRIIELLGPGAMEHDEVVVYDIGMRRIRSDPYTGMAMLYEYLYAGGPHSRRRNVVLNMPHILREEWRAKSVRSPNRKDIRLFRQVADAILFSDGAVAKADLD